MYLSSDIYICTLNMVRLDLLVYIFLLVGDFFDGSTMPKADLYLLGHVCHDWTDSECAKIAKCSNAISMIAVSKAPATNSTRAYMRASYTR